MPPHHTPTTSGTYYTLKFLIAPPPLGNEGGVGLGSLIGGGAGLGGVGVGAGTLAQASAGLLLPLLQYVLGFHDK
jgi:hypothetical protein